MTKVIKAEVLELAHRPWCMESVFTVARETGTVMVRIETKKPTDIRNSDFYSEWIGDVAHRLLTALVNDGHPVTPETRETAILHLIGATRPGPRYDWRRVNDAQSERERAIAELDAFLGQP